MDPDWLTAFVIGSFGVSCFALGGSATFLILCLQRRVKD